MFFTVAVFALSGLSIAYETIMFKTLRRMVSEEGGKERSIDLWRYCTQSPDYFLRYNQRAYHLAQKIARVGILFAVIHSVIGCYVVFFI